MRQLEREIGAVVPQGRARRSPRDGATEAASIGEARGRASCSAGARFHAEARRRTRVPGVATGLAWTPVGGDVLFIEASAMPGKGKLHDHRPARRRDEGVRAGGADLGARPRAELAPGLADDWFATHDIHVHVPAGAIPKDGPSAGITMATALASLLTGRRVRDDVAMTGEITLTGQVLPIGGLKEKALAAQRNGITHGHRARSSTSPTSRRSPSTCAASSSSASSSEIERGARGRARARRGA